MYSEAPAIMNRNTELYIIDEMKTTINEQQTTVDEPNTKISNLEAQLKVALEEIAKSKNIVE